MAVYEYEILGPDGVARGIYEAEQRMGEAPLTEHPITGEPLRRILSVTFAHGSSHKADVSSCSSGTCGGSVAGGCASGMCGWN